MTEDASGKARTEQGAPQPPTGLANSDLTSKSPTGRDITDNTLPLKPPIWRMMRLNENLPDVHKLCRDLHIQPGLEEGERNTLLALHAFDIHRAVDPDLYDLLYNKLLYFHAVGPRTYCEENNMDALERTNAGWIVAFVIMRESMFYYQKLRFEAWTA